MNTSLLWYISGVGLALSGIIPLTKGLFNDGIIENDPNFFVIAGLWLSMALLGIFAKKQINQFHF